MHDFHEKLDILRIYFISTKQQETENCSERIKIVDAERREELRRKYDALNGDPVQIAHNESRQENHSTPSDTDQYIAHARAGIEDLRASIQDLPLGELI